MGRMAQINPARMLRALGRSGFVLHRQSGSHAVLIKAGQPPVTVPVHTGTLKQGTARAILRQACVDEEDFFAVY